MFDDHLPQTKIPVRFVNGHWEYFYGGGVPVAEGTFGELTLAHAWITDPAFAERLSKKIIVKVLDEETPLMVALTVPEPNLLASNLKQHLEQPKDWRMAFHNDKPLSEHTHFVKVVIGPAAARKANGASEKHVQTMLPGLGSGGLWLHLKGTCAEKIVSSSIALPLGIAAVPAQSLNHAFTILSERYETTRISHTGNVYQRVFYQEKDSHWYPLDCLRSSEEAGAERGLINETWQQVARQLGLDLRLG